MAFRGRPRVTCDRDCGRERDLRMKRNARFGVKIGAVKNAAAVGELREFRHWALTGQWVSEEKVWRLLTPAERTLRLKTLEEVWSVHTCKVCRNGIG